MFNYGFGRYGSTSSGTTLHNSMQYRGGRNHNAQNGVENQTGYNPKYTRTYKKESNNNITYALGTATLMLAAGMIGYKGKNIIQKGLSTMSKATKAAGTTAKKGFSQHCPNLSQSAKYFGEACKTPFKYIKNIGPKAVNGTQNIIQKSTTFIKNLFKKPTA